MHRGKESLGLVFVFALLAWATVLSPAALCQKPDLFDRVRTSRSVDINADNSEVPPVTISRARVKTLAAEGYKALTGSGGAVAEQYVSFPETRISNNSDKTITMVGLVISDRKSPGKHWFEIIHENMSPSSNLVDPATGWVAVPRSGIADATRAAWTSPGMWLPGSPEDITICVAKVDFADGTSWITSR